MTCIGSSTDNSDVGQASFLSQVEDFRDAFVSDGTTDVANSKDFVTLQQVSFGDDPSGHIQVSET